MSSRNRLNRGAGAAVLALLVAGCAAEDGASTGPNDSADGAADALVGDVASGKADGWTIDEARLGGSYRYQVAAKQGGDVTPAHAKILRFEATAGQAFAAVMRRTDATELDAALLLYAADGTADAQRVRSSLYEQALVPMGVAQDAVIVYEAPTTKTYLLYASDRELAVSGAFQVDLVDLGLAPAEPTVVDAWSDLDLSVTHAGLRAYSGLLRDREPEMVDYVTRGALEEGADGYLVAHEDNVDSLAERAELRQFVTVIDDTRARLFESYGETVSSENPLLIDRIGQAAGGVWSALRSADHAMP
ncbi:MAG: hypothetical protein JRI23_01240 [Deltaproteobacteria bacterium]|jgi:hypothetical protein|nr:hypothetical protein [Deltaproteobacteria bacterium]MBW2530079.1 hypothetical protein [Deltaproteobacteria bacterium]